MISENTRYRVGGDLTDLEADQLGLGTVLVAQPVGDGIAVAIGDRLKCATFGKIKT